MKNNLDTRKAILILTFLILSSLSFVNASSSNTCLPNIILVNQDPTYAVPDNYVKIVFQVSGVDNVLCNGMSFEIVPMYPFSLDSGQGLVKVLKGNSYTPGYNGVWNIPYTLRVDKDALDGDNQVAVHYSTTVTDNSTYAEQKFNITVKDSRTSFDSVVQSVSGSQVSIAIANTGKYAANSVIVRVPDQDNYRATGTNGQMVGNLASGDYTLVSFTVTPTSARNGNQAGSNVNNNLNNPLLFQIAYTDTLGVRRIVNMSLPLNINSFNSNSTFSGSSNFAGRRTTPPTSSTNWYLTIGVIFVVLVLGFIYKKYFEKKDDEYKSTRKIEAKKGETPDWVKNVKDKEKIK